MHKFSEVFQHMRLFVCSSGARKIYLAKWFAKVYNIPSGKEIEPGYEMDDKIAELIK